MTLHIQLPPDVEARLLDEVRTGRHASLEDAALEKLSRSEAADLLAQLDSAAIRRDLDAAWNDRSDAVDGANVFARLSDKSAALKAQGR